MAPTAGEPLATGQETTWAAPGHTKKGGFTARRPMPRTPPTSAPRELAHSVAAHTRARATSRT
eukprot:2483047-Lingulodinium_polyedra.AAC.1